MLKFLEIRWNRETRAECPHRRYSAEPGHDQSNHKREFVPKIIEEGKLNHRDGKDEKYRAGYQIGFLQPNHSGTLITKQLLFLLMLAGAGVKDPQELQDLRRGFSVLHPFFDVADRLQVFAAQAVDHAKPEVGRCRLRTQRKSKPIVPLGICGSSGSCIERSKFLMQEKGIGDCNEALLKDRNRAIGHIETNE